MLTRQFQIIGLLLAFAARAVVLAQTPAVDPALQRLEREMARLAGVAGGVAGASAVHIESGRRASLNGTERFPMASSYKVPIAVQLLTRVDQGALSLDRMVALERSDLHPGSGTLSDLFNKPGVALSVRNLLELMLLISDNSATDMILRLAGGPEAVTARMRALGIAGIDVSRPTARLIADWAGIPALPPESEWSPELFQRLLRAVPPEEKKAAAKRFDADPRDTATPEAMAALLERIHRQDLLRPESAALLLDIMRRCRSGEGRLRGILPAGTELAHKTGTIGGTTNDVGILTLPGDAGHVALAVFVKSSEKEIPARERAIAEIARAVHDFFLFQVLGAAAALNYDAMAARIIGALKLRPGERVLMRFDPGYFSELIEPLRRRIREAGAVDLGGNPRPQEFEQRLEATDVYLWLPLRGEAQQLTAPDRLALQRWLDKGGARREIHFHWSEGSVRPDGLPGEHSATLDAIYQSALDIDYAELSAAQDRAIALLRSGTVRVRTPAGTDLRFRIGSRPFNKQNGDASADRMLTARVRVDREIELPAGVLRVAPLEETVNGHMVIPEARFGGKVARDLRLQIQNGRVVRIAAAENLSAVETALAAGGDAGRRFREFGLGFNPKLRAPAGSPSLAYYGYGDGVVRLSLGDNQELGGAVGGGFVRWFFFPDATVEIDGRELVRSGKLLEGRQ